MRIAEKEKNVDYKAIQVREESTDAAFRNDAAIPWAVGNKRGRHRVPKKKDQENPSNDTKAIGDLPKMKNHPVDYKEESECDEA